MVIRILLINAISFALINTTLHDRIYFLNEGYASWPALREAMLAQQGATLNDSAAFQALPDIINKLRDTLSAGIGKIRVAILTADLYAEGTVIGVQGEGLQNIVLMLDGLQYHLPLVTITSVADGQYTKAISESLEYDSLQETVLYSVIDLNAYGLNDITIDDVRPLPLRTNQ